MKRLFEKKLYDWKISSIRKPLIVRGARQVGKTYSIEAFGKDNFMNVIKIDFEQTPSFIKIFDGDLVVAKIIELIEVEKDTNIILGETLLFFDEIQLCPRALMSLRYFYENLPDLHLIVAGSLLEFELNKISFPVGRVEFQRMYPLSFEEFLIATDNYRLLKYRPILNDINKLPDTIHDKFLKLLREYFVVGGMPEAVKTYITKSMSAVSKIHSDLITSFLQDIIKYEKGLDLDSLRVIFEKIPSLVGQEIKYTTISTDLSIYKIKKILEILEKALLIHPVVSSSAKGLPLMSGVNSKVFKYCFFDIGLMQHICGISQMGILLQEDLLANYAGRLCEQYIGQELIACGGSQNNHLFYWRRNKKNSNAEVDYLIVKDGNIYPIEIKNGPSGKLKSLHLFLEEHCKIEKGFVLNSGNIGTLNNIFFLPIYSKLD